MIMLPQSPQQTLPPEGGGPGPILAPGAGQGQGQGQGVPGAAPAVPLLPDPPEVGDQQLPAHGRVILSSATRHSSITAAIVVLLSSQNTTNCTLQTPDCNCIAIESCVTVTRNTYTELRR